MKIIIKIIINQLISRSHVQTKKLKTIIWQIDELSRPEFTASFNEEQQLMRWSLSNSRITASADWKYDWKKNRIIRLKDSGSLVVSANDISMIIDWKLKYDSSTGRPIIETTHCESKVGNINLDLKGKASFVYNMILR